jgi:hypothetical protein
MEKEGMKDKRGDEALPFFFNRRKDFDQKTMEHWQGIACRFKQETKSEEDQAMCQDLDLLPNNDSDCE